MDPRIHWQDIFMRVEVSGRTAEADRKLQNSTNNLINRQEHRRFFMLSWHTTGANRTTRNVTRNMVLDRVANARPPLPPNSTRGLTPGLINPRLGNVPGNSIPFPPLRGQNVGRLRVLGRPRPTRATAAVAANPGQGNPVLGDRAQKSPVQHSRARGSRERGYTVPTKRNRASPGRQGRSPKRRALHILDDTSEDYVETRSEGTKSSEV